MPRFAFSGRNAQGLQQGELEAASPRAAADALLAQGITPLNIKALAAGAAVAVDAGPSFGERLKSFFERRIDPVDMLILARQLHTLLKAGVPILRALAGLTESAASQQMKNTLLAVRQSLESGIELSRSFAQQPRVFDHFFVAMVRVGEMTGRLDEIFLRLFHHMEFEQFMRQQVKSALRYPSFVVAAMVIAIGVINVLVIPAFAGVFANLGAELPLATRLLLASSRFTIDYGWALLLGAGVGVWLLGRWIATPSGRLAWDRFKLRLPVAGPIVLKAQLARFSRSLALALRSGVPVEQALTVVAQTTDNQFIAQKVEGMRAGIERGESLLRSAIAAQVFTPVVLQMIAVGEETGAVDELMQEVADLYGNEVQYELKTLGQQIEPILIVFLGVLVLILALGVFLPIWDLGRASMGKGAEVWRNLRGLSLMEFAIVIAIMAVLLTLLLQRLGEAASEARRVQLRMAVEALRINAALLQLRCNAEMLEPSCWARALAQRRSAEGLSASPSAVQAPSHTGVPGLLTSVALAAGLGEHANGVGAWVWTRPDPQRLQLAPQGVAHCRLELHWQAAKSSVEVFAVEDRC